MDDDSEQGLLNMTVPSVWKTKRGKPKTLADELGAFEEFGKETIVLYNQIAGLSVPVFINEFWTSGQRQANKLHEISYRACFKPQLPKFFIDRLTEAGDVVYDPFMGRGTTLIEAALLGRVPMGCDINPLSSLLTAPRLRIPNIEDIEARLRSLELDEPIETREDLLAFYHPNVLTKVSNLRQYFIDRRAAHSAMRLLLVLAAAVVAAAAPGQSAALLSAGTECKFGSDGVIVELALEEGGGREACEGGEGGQEEDGAGSWACGLAGGSRAGNAGRVFLVEDCGARVRIARTVRLV